MRPIVNTLLLALAALLALATLRDRMVEREMRRLLAGED